VAIGTDIIHMHPEADGAAIGKGSMNDFRLLASVVADLEGAIHQSGFCCHIAEVFEGAERREKPWQQGGEYDYRKYGFYPALQTGENVLRRPTLRSGRNFALTGHHEIMFPLLTAAIIEEMP
jgi:hypothetical protein